MLELTPEQKILHEKALELSAQYRRIEWLLVETLQQIDRSKLYKKLNRSSLFQYAVQELGLSEAIAYAFIAVARKALESAELTQALKAQSLSVSKAVRIVSTLNPENAKSLVEFSKTHSSRAIDFEVARLNPKSARREKVRPLNETEVELTTKMSKETLQKLKRIESLEAQRGKKPLNLAHAIDAAADEYLFRRDPVKKAERAKPSGPCSSRVYQSQRVKLPASIKHSVFLRDKGQCTHVDANEVRCSTDRWLHIHHLRPLSQGGTNEISNLTTLCSFHHDLVHQPSLPIDGQVNCAKPSAFSG